MHHTMHHNFNGLIGRDHAVIDLYGENTDIHSNTSYGIFVHSDAKVQIHLPSTHNTSHAIEKKIEFKKVEPPSPTSTSND